MALRLPACSASCPYRHCPDSNERRHENTTHQNHQYNAGVLLAWDRRAFPHDGVALGCCASYKYMRYGRIVVGACGRKPVVREVEGMTETSGDVVMRGLPWSFGYNVSASRARDLRTPPPPPDFGRWTVSADDLGKISRRLSANLSVREPATQAHHFPDLLRREHGGSRHAVGCRCFRTEALSPQTTGVARPSASIRSLAFKPMERDGSRPRCVGSHSMASPPAGSDTPLIHRLKTHGHSPSCVAFHYGTGAGKWHGGDQFRVSSSFSYLQPRTTCPSKKGDFHDILVVFSCTKSARSLNRFDHGLDGRGLRRWRWQQS